MTSTNEPSERGRADVHGRSSASFAHADGYLLTGEAELSQLARDAVDLALRGGAAHALASASATAGIVMRARGGAFDSATQEGGQNLTVQVFCRGRTGHATTSALSQEAISTVVERAMGIAGAVEADPDALPAEPSWLAPVGEHVPLFAPSMLAAQDLGAMALAAEAAALDTQDGAVRVLDAGASSLDHCSVLAIDRTFDRAYRASRQDIWCSAIAERTGLMTQDSWSSSDRRLSHLLDPADVGGRAAHRAVRKLGARTVESRTCPVLFDAIVASTLVHDIASALTGAAQFQKMTIWPEGKGTQALVDHVDLTEDAFEPYGLASGAYDSEGVGGLKRALIRAGIVEDFFLSSLYARKLGLKSTGNADGVRNLALTSRKPPEPLSSLLQVLGSGLWVTELLGGSLDPVSGAYSKAVGGFWVERGEVAYPVQDITIAGELPHMLHGILAIGADVERRGAVRCGSVLIDRMHVSGR